MTNKCNGDRFTCLIGDYLKSLGINIEKNYKIEVGFITKKEHRFDVKLFQRAFQKKSLV